MENGKKDCERNCAFVIVNKDLRVRRHIMLKCKYCSNNSE